MNFKIFGSLDSGTSCFAVFIALGEHELSYGWSRWMGQGMTTMFIGGTGRW